MELLVTHADQPGAAPIVRAVGPLGPAEMIDESVASSGGVARYKIAATDVYIASREVERVGHSVLGWHIVMNTGVVVEVR